MELLKDTETDLPVWMRVTLLVFGGVFAALAWWLGVAPGADWERLLGAGLSAALALLLLVSAARGRIWRWMWLFPG